MRKGKERKYQCDVGAQVVDSASLCLAHYGRYLGTRCILDDDTQTKAWHTSRHMEVFRSITTYLA